MRYLTLELCKAHLVVDHDEDDNIITQYANSVENNIERQIECPLSELEDANGELPADLVGAMLLFLGSLYANREGLSTQNVMPTASIAALIQPFKTYGYKRR